MSINPSNPSNKLSLTINLDPDNSECDIYYPDYFDLINPEKVSNEEKTSFNSVYLCMSCDRLLLNPVECSICKIRKCKKCATLCEHSENYYEEINIPELNELKFKCVNGCDINIPYNLFIKHYEFMCPKFKYKEQFDKVYGEYLSMVDSYNNVHKQLEELRKEHSRIVRSKVGNDGSNNKIKIDKHRHELNYNSNLNGINCSNCNNYYPNVTQGFICERCNYNLCPICFVKLTTK